MTEASLGRLAALAVNPAGTETTMIGGEELGSADVNSVRAGTTMIGRMAEDALLNLDNLFQVWSESSRRMSRGLNHHVSMNALVWIHILPPFQTAVPDVFRITGRGGGFTQHRQYVIHTRHFFGIYIRDTYIATQNNNPN